MTVQILKLVLSAIASIGKFFVTLLSFFFGLARACNPYASPMHASNAASELPVESAAIEFDRRRAAEVHASTARLEAESKRIREAVYFSDFFTIERIEKDQSTVWLYVHDDAHGTYSFSLPLDVDGCVAGEAEWPDAFVHTLQSIDPEDRRATLFYAAEKAINDSLGKLPPTPPVNQTSSNVVVLNKFNQGNPK